MMISPEIITALAALIVASIALYSAYNATKALHHKNRLTSVTLVADALRVFATDKDMQSIFYKIEYGEFVHDENFAMSAEERQLDRLLRHFAATAHACDNKVIRQEDMMFIHYYICRIVMDEQVGEYLTFLLKGWVPVHGLNHPYQTLAKFRDEKSQTSSQEEPPSRE